VCHLLVVEESEFALRQAVVLYYETKEPFYLPAELAEGEEVFLATKDGIVAYAEVLFSEYTTRPADPHWLTEGDEQERTYACLDLISVDLRHPLLGSPLSGLQVNPGQTDLKGRQWLVEAWQAGHFESDVTTIEQAKNRRMERFRERNHLAPLKACCEMCGNTQESILEWHEHHGHFQTLCPTCHRLAHQSIEKMEDVAATSDQASPKQ